MDKAQNSIPSNAPSPIKKWEPGNSIFNKSPKTKNYFSMVNSILLLQSLPVIYPQGEVILQSMGLNSLWPGKSRKPSCRHTTGLLPEGHHRAWAQPGIPGAHVGNGGLQRTWTIVMSWPTSPPIPHTGPYSWAGLPPLLAPPALLSPLCYILGHIPHTQYCKTLFASFYYS